MKGKHIQIKLFVAQLQGFFYIGYERQPDLGIKLFLKQCTVSPSYSNTKKKSTMK